MTGKPCRIRMTANTLLLLSWPITGGGLFGIVAAGIASFFTDRAQYYLGTAFALAGLLLIVGVIMLFIGLHLDQIADERRFERAKKEMHAKIPYAPYEKPEDYNATVTKFFFDGPELRRRDEDFHRGFAARAIVPPPTRRR